jgi:hypothetical protein
MAMVKHEPPTSHPMLTAVARDDRDVRDPSDIESVDAEQAVLLAFAPLHKRALGVGVGVASALLLALLTGLTLLHAPDRRFPMHLLGEFLAGYDVSVRGIFVGAGWGLVVGFVAGWFFAFCRNLAVALSIFVIRTRAEMAQTRDFLDHI